VTELNKRDVHSVDGILFDLGVSSPQLDNGERGFSYNYDARLDMRMNKDDKLDAYTVVNTYSENDLRKLIFTYGEERYAASIARNIVESRKNKKIETTFELVEIIKKSVPTKYLKETHPAKRTFQAIRIEVNDELNGLKEALDKAMTILNPKGRIVVITFHSLEDRIVKEKFKEASEAKHWNRYMPVTSNDDEIEYRIINKKPILPSEDELSINRRSHSAKLRIIEKN
jgi:16S rRNA (cytosine1402-N4)-methyltransferase